MSLLPSDILALIEVAVDEAAADCTGVLGRIGNFFGEVVTDNDFQSQCEHLVEQLYHHVEVLRELAPMADLGAPEDVEPFARDLEQLLPLIEEHLADSDLLKRFVDEVVKPTAATAAKVATTAVGGFALAKLAPVALLLLSQSGK